MNNKKLYSELVKWYFSKNKSMQSFHFGVYKENIVVSIEGHTAHIIPLDQFIFNGNLDSRIDKKPLNFAQILDVNTDGYKLVTDRSSSISVEGRKKPLQVLKAADGTQLYCNSEYLTYFDKDCTLYIRKPNEPIRIFENDDFVGLIFPVKHNN